MKVCILGYTIAFKLFIVSHCLDSSNECVKEDDIIVEDSDDSDDQVDPTHATEAHLNPRVVDKLITVIVAFLLKFRIVYHILIRAIIVLLRFKYLLLLFGQSFGVSSQLYLLQSIPGCYSYL